MRDGVSDTSAAQNSVVQQLLVVELCKLKTFLSTSDLHDSLESLPCCPELAQPGGYR